MGWAWAWWPAGPWPRWPRPWARAPWGHSRITSSPGWSEIRSLRSWRSFRRRSRRWGEIGKWSVFRIQINYAKRGLSDGLVPTQKLYIIHNLIRANRIYFHSELDICEIEILKKGFRMFSQDRQECSRPTDSFTKTVSASEPKLESSSWDRGYI